MNDDEIRLLKIEGQINALAHAWLRLAAELEVQGQMDPQALRDSLLRANWQGAPMEPYAQQLMRYLVDELAEARESRDRQAHYRLTGKDE
jgi:hypothetical protein